MDAYEGDNKGKLRNLLLKMRKIRFPAIFLRNSFHLVSPLKMYSNPRPSYRVTSWHQSLVKVKLHYAEVTL